MKTCVTCGIEKEVDCFYVETKAPDGRRKECKQCKDKKVVSRRKDRKEEWNAYMRKYNKEHPGHTKAKKYITNSTLKWRYGVTLDQKTKMFHDQQGLCMICKKQMENLTKAYIDHNHKTGKVRDLLCQPCNTYLGYILEDNAIANSLSAYILKHS